MKMYWKKDMDIIISKILNMYYLKFFLIHICFCLIFQLQYLLQIKGGMHVYLRDSLAASNSNRKIHLYNHINKKSIVAMTLIHLKQHYSTFCRKIVDCLNPSIHPSIHPSFILTLLYLDV